MQLQRQKLTLINSVCLIAIEIYGDTCEVISPTALIQVG